MYLQQIRNATIFLYYGGKTFLIDPILAPKGSWTPRAIKAMADWKYFQLTFQSRYFSPVLLKLNIGFYYFNLLSKWISWIFCSNLSKNNFSNTCFSQVLLKLIYIFSFNMYFTSVLLSVESALIMLRYLQVRSLLQESSFQIPCTGSFRYQEEVLRKSLTQPYQLSYHLI